jgi:glycosyltransferase involved in cell wall biosynthesis
MLKKFKEFGFDEKKLFLTNYCYDIGFIDRFLEENAAVNSSQAGNGAEGNGYIFYVGRIEAIKGVKTLLDAVKGTGIPLKIAGSGAELASLTEYAKNEGIDNAEFFGFQDKKSVFTLTTNAKFVVCPSEWYENFPFSITESFLLSKPVIGADAGGIPELVLDGQTGYLFERGNAADLRTKLLKLWNSEESIKLMGQNARNHAYKIFNYGDHWQKLSEVFSRLNVN